ncbi:hypothetical protein JCGZ_22542 [Jatropha curcas]|uniref:Zinc finger PHD-type domain-containing protein n=1 Tax=Jatropha curcas TaxID=180498 RepID=A0A067K0P9_JATCU|nr:PHD finger protein MALE MEIOCYTE DEATH 1 [Jatropha curcas]KDP25820.1 hypothetical protein JCGZ_22542 [Jatropha curcas]
MSLPFLEACRKRKRRPKLYNFHSFGDPGCPISPMGPFRDNIRIFLQECAVRQDYTIEGMPIWSTLLLIESNSFVVPLYTIEENVKYSSNPFCDHCRCTGWGDNFVSKRRYHLIIPNDSEWNEQLEGVFDLQNHLLHGLIHCNGFGHLLCINGIEGGSKILCGREIMDLWDRLCANLQARKISVQDVSKKRGMELRLLYGVAYGHSWFGRWGYKFCRGSFGVKLQNYNQAIEILCSLELDKIIEEFKDTKVHQEMKQIISFYRNFSETPLITFKDLLRFMLIVKSCPCAQKKRSIDSNVKSSMVIASQKKPVVKEKYTRYRKFSSLVGTLDSRWSKKRLEYAAEVIVSALKEKRTDKFSQQGMTRQDVRDAARMHIGDTGLLDYVLKSMNNVIVGNHVVHRAMNLETRILEYSIDELDNRKVKVTEPEEEEVADPIPVPSLVPGADLYGDMGYLYMKVLMNYPESELVETATQAILDSKHFVKEWPFENEEDQLLRYICQVMPNIIEAGTKFTRELPPGEIIMLPLHATVAELKRAAENALKDTYYILENFVVTEIELMEELEDWEVLFGVVESGSELFMKGNGVDLNTELRYEAGPDNWKVRCECGAQDDDGERMVACDICEVWEHTRCNGIDDSKTVPPLFICTECCNSVVKPTNELQVEFENSDHLLMVPPNAYVAELVK